MATLTTPVVTTDVGQAAATGMVPIVIDLGKKKKKKIKDLKRGRGKLMLEIATVMNEIRASLGEEAQSKQLVPVVMIYKEKRRRRRDGGSLLFPFL